jgi:cystathionine beta-lyase/cystathionine gamma-synthase
MRQVENAGVVARALEGHPRVRRVHYPGLPSHADHAIAAAQLDGPGAMVAFELDDGAAARWTYDRLRLIRRAASLGDVESLILHPVSTSHRTMAAADRARAGIVDGLLRLSVGIEDPRDLVDDLLQALG